MMATAPETKQGQLAVKIFVHLLARIDKQGGGLLIAQVTAAVGIGGVHLEFPHR
jgi:hypothetical protein